VCASATFTRIVDLVGRGDWSASDHALQRIAEYAIIGVDLEDGIGTGVAVEDYPDYHAGPCVLVLQADRRGPVHVLWGLKLGTDRPAVLVTAYRPDQTRWLDNNRTRKS
jgi:hypothetical protein